MQAELIIGNSFKASAAALRKHPYINSSWYDDKITVHQDINIGVAVAIEEGLMVPVIRAYLE